MQMFRQSTNQNHHQVFGELVMSLDGINGPSIQTLLRGENDLKQSDEFQTNFSPKRTVVSQVSCVPWQNKKEKERLKEWMNLMNEL